MARKKPFLVRGQVRGPSRKKLLPRGPPRAGLETGGEFLSVTRSAPGATKKIKRGAVNDFRALDYPATGLSFGRGAFR